jgi:homoserine O-succinyltransferase
MEAFLYQSERRAPNARSGDRTVRREQAPAGKRRLAIALVNNMPDAALVATERQFTRLAMAAAGNQADIGLFHIPALPRGEEARQILAERYLPVTDLYSRQVDAVIITGNEPRAARLDEEPYWGDLARLIDWVAARQSPSLWSCLAAHAAVLHLDGIERRRLPQKKHGVLACTVNAVASSLPDTLSTCHSRLNGVVRAELVSKGYGIVSEAPEEHVDIFTKTFGAPFLFLQGHPEYDVDSLMREYRRDVGRYLTGQRDTYPELPENYFDTATADRMQAYRAEAERSRDARLFETFPEVGLRPRLENRLARSAAAVFGHWMEQVAQSAMAR